MNHRIAALLVVFAIVICQASAQETEITLWDRYGKAIAYVAPEKEMTVYLFDGTPVAYLLLKGDRNYIYGFNGKHLGWFVDGILRDLDGDAVGCQKDMIRMIYELEPLKGLKKDLPLKKPIEPPPPMPVPRHRWSQAALSMFLHQGIARTDAHKLRQSQTE